MKEIIESLQKKIQDIEEKEIKLIKKKDSYQYSMKRQKQKGIRIAIKIIKTLEKGV